MGCVSSKSVITSPPRIESSGVSGNLDGASGISGASFWNRTDAERSESGESAKISSNNSSGVQSLPARNLYKYIEGEQVVAGWPGWLIAVAREAIYGWVPLRAESYEKLEKIGEGTYSNVFKARDLDTGKIVALKKVRFDNFEPESVRFMAREIMILRRLNHPNIVKLEGLITSRRSCSIYLVFEYMEHDLAGLSSSPDIKFSESQVKCYMHQLLSGLEHCHSHGIMHRDIKCANLLVSNEGVLKIADFGLANFCNAERRQPLTTRVVTLWYRPPELLLGSTDYEATVDLWSVGCVFAEIILGKPVLQGRTEVEQIHKIFKLCGSPPDDYWKKIKLPHAKLFKPHQSYEKSLMEKFKCLPESAFKLLETLLSIEPYKRGTSKSALSSEYFRTKPYACEPSSLPKYPANKEMDAKLREDSLRNRFYAREKNEPDATRRPSRIHTMKQPNVQSKLVERPEEKWKKTYSTNENCGAKLDLPRKDVENRLFVDLQLMPSINFRNEAHRHPKQASHGARPFSGPLQPSDFSGLVWAKRQKGDHSSNKAFSKPMSSSGVLQPKNINEFKAQVQADVSTYGDSKHRTTFEMGKQEMLKKWIESGEHHDTSVSRYDDQHHHHQKGYLSGLSDHYNLGYQDQGNRIELSGPLLQEDKINELLEKHERHIRHEVRKSWLQRG